MSTCRSIFALSLFAALGAAVACSSPDPTGLIGAPNAPVNTGSGEPADYYDAGAQPAPIYHDSGASPAPTPTATTSPASDSGSAPWYDAGGGSSYPDAGSQGSTQGSPGSCTNPICGSDGQGDCGCFATDSMGNSVEIGCNGDDCACFVNQQQNDDDVEYPGACSSNGDTLQAFLVECTCL